MRGIFDTHAHYDDRAFDEDREEILAQLKEQGYSGIVDIGASFESCKKAVEISNTHDIVYATVGIHPDCIEDFFEGENNRNTSGNRVIEEMYNMIKNNKKVVAVGEIGFDYHNMTCEKDLQEIWFRAQLDMAKELSMPVVIHSREAERDTEVILREYLGKLPPSIMHCYSYSKESAREFVQMDYYLGIGGVVTFKNAKKLVEAVEDTPLSKIVLETDCPYLSPEPNRGKRNSSLNLPYIVEKIAQIKNVDPEEVIEVTTSNAKELYGIPI